MGVPMLDSSVDWREVARGIPVTPGSKVLGWSDVDPPNPGKWMSGYTTTADVFPGGVAINTAGGRYLGALARRNVIPDLADPYARAGFDCDLALALGCPADLADEAFVTWGGSGGLLIAAGVPKIVHLPDADDPALDYPWGVEVGEEWALVRTPENLLRARALAWPLDKRVAA